MDGKYWWQSRTIWLNGAWMLVSMITVAGEVILNAGTVVTGTTVLMAVLASLNWYLRYQTSQPILTKGADPDEHL